MGITEQARLESYLALDTVKRKQMILECFDQHGDMTARQCGYRLGFSDLNAVKPRITELTEAGRLVPLNKVTDNVTGRKVTIYSLAG